MTSALELACGTPSISPFDPRPILGNSSCLKFVISKALGYGIVVGSAGVKMPQVYKIIKAGGVEGLSGPTVLIEWAASIASFAYFMGSGYPFSTWGENLFLFFQNGIIATLYLRYTTGLGSSRFMSVALASTVMGAVLYLRALPDFDLPPALCQGLGVARCTITSTDVAGTLPVVLMLFGRLPQILQNQRQGHTGALALATYLLNVLGAGARIFTVLQELNDKLVLTSTISAFLQNLILVSQILLLGAAPKKRPSDKKGA